MARPTQTPAKTTAKTPAEVEAFVINVMSLLRTRMMFTLGAVLVSLWLSIAWLVYNFEKGEQGANITSYWDGVWWGIVTLLTVGYGDKFPITVPGRLLGMALMITGVIAMGIVTAKISSHFLSQVLLEGRGLVDKSKLKDHFVVCGWQEDMQDLLTHILESNRDLKAGNLVIVANISQTKIDDLRSDERLLDVKFILGDSYHEATLDRANPKTARKVLILADRTPGPGGQIPTDSEADARTILSAITISNIARGTIVTAEILNPQLDYYLKMSGVSEIIYSREYSRLLLGKSAGGTGISNVIYDLLNPANGSQITTCPIDVGFIEKPYGDFKKSFEAKNPGALLIGILENTGNMHRIREVALRDAQKTANVENFIQNLRAVKHLKCNNPVFHPPEDYVIKQGAAAIVIMSAGAPSADEPGSKSHATTRNSSVA